MSHAGFPIAIHVEPQPPSSRPLLPVRARRIPEPPAPEITRPTTIRVKLPPLPAPHVLPTPTIVQIIRVPAPPAPPPPPVQVVWEHQPPPKQVTIRIEDRPAEEYRQPPSTLRITTPLPPSPEPVLRRPSVVKINARALLPEREIPGAPPYREVPPPIRVPTPIELPSASKVELVSVDELGRETEAPYFGEPPLTAITIPPTPAAMRQSRPASSIPPVPPLLERKEETKVEQELLSPTFIRIPDEDPKPLPPLPSTVRAVARPVEVTPPVEPTLIPVPLSPPPPPPPATRTVVRLRKRPPRAPSAPPNPTIVRFTSPSAQPPPKVYARIPSEAEAGRPSKLKKRRSGA